jgi:polysaccharide biosynthesis/export protein
VVYLRYAKRQILLARSVVRIAIIVLVVWLGPILVRGRESDLMARSTIRIASIALLGCAVAACSSLGENPAATPENPNDLASPADYKLGGGDKIRVKVYGVEQVGGDFDIDPAGFIDSPLIGRMQAQGLTTVELKSQIAAKLKRGNIVDDPQVSVELLAPHPFYVLGEVEKSGEYPYRAGLNVESAVATAGGYRYRANQNKIYIRRRGQAGEVVVSPAAAPPVYPGDIVRIPGRIF